MYNVKYSVQDGGDEHDGVDCRSQQGYMFNIECHCCTGAHLPRKRAGYQQEGEARQEEERNAFWGEAAESGVRR